MDEEDEGNTEPLVRVQFLTEHEKYRVTETSIAVPSRLSRRGLSEVINHLLTLDPPIPFDFEHLDTGKLLRAPLAKFLASEEISRELLIKLKYAPAINEPEKKSSEESPDWISSIDAGRKFVSDKDSCCVVSGCYDGTIQLYSLDKNGKFQHLEAPKAHRGSVKSVSQCASGEHYVASSGTDGEIKLWSVDDSTKRLGLRARCTGHKKTVESVSAINFDSHTLVASGGWDRSVCLWKINMNLDENSEEINTAKKRKTSSSNGNSDKVLEIETPSCRMNEHTDNVSSVIWGGSNTLYSGSWDHSLKSWDVTRECCTATLNGSKVVTSLSFCEASQMLASSHADNAVRIWDARASGDSIVKLELKSHKKWVSDVAWSGSNEHLLASSSHDNTVKVWDIRTKIPLYTLTPHTSKALCIDWESSFNHIISGGADSKLEVSALKS